MQLHDEVTVYNEERNEEQNYKIIIKYASSVDLSPLTQYMSANFPLDMPQRAIQALDVVLRSAPATRYFEQYYL